MNINVSKCRLDPVRIKVGKEKQLVENPRVIIHNSSFGGLNLPTKTEALITQCFIDAELKDRSTLITANNSNVSIQNCQFGKFINNNGSTILFGHNNSHVTIENSIFNQHNSSKGVLLLRGNSSLRISSSLFLENVAFTLGYSAITLYEGIHAAVHDTIFRNNSALAGGALIAQG